MTAETWKLAQRLEPELWARLASGKLDEDTVECHISASLERAERMRRFNRSMSEAVRNLRDATKQWSNTISKIDWLLYLLFAKGGRIKPRREPQIVVDSRTWTGRY